ncbi:hypothetical protein L917_12956, partial [Phytophthora nicotianae]
MKALSGRFVLEKVVTVAGDVVWGRPTGQHHASPAAACGLRGAALQALPYANGEGDAGVRAA